MGKMKAYKIEVTQEQQLKSQLSSKNHHNQALPLKKSADKS